MYVYVFIYPFIIVSAWTEACILFRSKYCTTPILIFAVIILARSKHDKKLRAMYMNFSCYLSSVSNNKLFFQFGNRHLHKSNATVYLPEKIWYLLKLQAKHQLCFSDSLCTFHRSSKGSNRCYPYHWTRFKEDLHEVDTFKFHPSA